jgi:uncharacterized protein (TIGR03792 family)
VVEHLRLRVPRASRAAWLEAERGSWEPWLQRQPGFQGRELFWDAQQEEGVLLIRWASREQWKAIPLQELEQVQQRFEQLALAALRRSPAAGAGSAGPNPFPLLFSGELEPLATAAPPALPTPVP